MFAFVSDVWWGRRSLAQTYWGWGALLGFFLAIPQLVMQSLGPQGTVPNYLWWVLVLGPYRVWSTVGIWRSASRSQSGWAVLAKVGVTLSMIYLVLIFAASFFVTPSDITK
jgi:hypothetical protein